MPRHQSTFLSLFIFFLLYLPDSIFSLPLLPCTSFLIHFFLYPFTDAVVTLAFTKYNIYNYISRENWSRQHVLELAVGDVITDVELVC